MKTITKFFYKNNIEGLIALEMSGNESIFSHAQYNIGQLVKNCSLNLYAFSVWLQTVIHLKLIKIF